MRYLIMNEQHSLLPDQRRALCDRFGAENDPNGWTRKNIPSGGMKIAEMRAWITACGCMRPHPTMIFLSPIAGLMILAARRGIKKLYALHNDKREAIETRLPDGSLRLTHRTAPDGWEIIP